jgi:hypothetical protein
MLGALQCSIPVVVLHLGIEIVAAITGAEGKDYWILCAALLLICLIWFARTALNVIYQLMFPLEKKKTHKP